jgi:FAD/FMN-containing dehydrogenase
MTVAPAIVERLCAAAGPGGWTMDQYDIAPHLMEARGLFRGVSPLLLKPPDTAAVAAIMAICHETRTKVVPQGGNTGLVGGATPFDGGDEVLLSLARMNRVRAIDALDNTLTVEAGCTLAAVQQAAASADRLFPLRIASEGSCTIGGNLSTNAGGTQVIRYGNTRDLVLGIEAVLPDGRVWNGLRALRKDNTGYDLKQLFIGGEGTLGIITAAVLKLFPRPRDVQTAMVAVPSPAAGIELLSLGRGLTGDQLTAFELMARIGLDFVLRHVPATADPFCDRHDWYALIEVSGGDSPGALRPAMEALLETALERGLAVDAVLAESVAQAQALWKLREDLSDAQKPEGGSIKHDISVPVSRMADFIARADVAVRALVPDCRPVAFGHVGDGNVHFNVSQPVGADRAAFLARWGEVNKVVHDIAAGLDGSISAEHGIGRLKRDELVHYKGAVELDLMRAVKAALDPRGIMNPGKMV